MYMYVTHIMTSGHCACLVIVFSEKCLDLFTADTLLVKPGFLSLCRQGNFFLACNKSFSEPKLNMA